jgi:anti-anti-sigma factor
MARPKSEWYCGSALSSHLIAEGKKKIVLNMANVTYIDSAGLGILVAAHVSAKTQRP